MDQIIEFLLYLQGPIPYVIAFIVLLGCGFGLPIPEDLTLFAMGLLSYYGLADVKISVIVCFAGVMIGDGTIFLLGKYYGKRITKKGPLKKVFSEERMEKTRIFFNRWGNKVIFAARFMPGLRTPIFFSAGTFKVKFRVFLFYVGLAALLSVPLLVYGMYYSGDYVDQFIHYARQAQHAMLALIVFLIGFYALKYKLSHKKKTDLQK